VTDGKPGGDDQEKWQRELRTDALATFSAALSIEGAEFDGAYRTTVVHSMENPGGVWAIYAFSEEPDLCWLRLVCKELNEPQIRITMGGVCALTALREAIDRILAHQATKKPMVKTADS
jgi:hypothetical protein